MKVHTYAFLLCQTAESPLVELGRSVYGSCNCILDECLADDVHGESLAAFQVGSRVFQAPTALWLTGG
jgi:hypothetical protein